MHSHSLLCLIASSTSLTVGFSWYYAPVLYFYLSGIMHQPSTLSLLHYNFWEHPEQLSLSSQLETMTFHNNLYRTMLRNRVATNTEAQWDDNQIQSTIIITTQQTISITFQDPTIMARRMITTVHVMNQDLYQQLLQNNPFITSVDSVPLCPTHTGQQNNGSSCYFVL